MSMSNDWYTRLVVTYVDDSGEMQEISPIQSFTPTFATSAEAMHSVERTHVGVVRSPHAFTFSMTVLATGPAAARLTALAFTGKRFDIALFEKVGNDWSFSSLVMKECVLTSANPGPASVSGVPQAVFGGFSMIVEATDSEDEKTIAPPQSKR